MKLQLNDLPSPANEFDLEECIGSGIFGEVFQAKNSQQRKVAIKIQKFNEENRAFIEKELKILQNFCQHPNLPTFFSAYKNLQGRDAPEIWFVMELCENGTVMNLVHGLLKENRRMTEEHIAFILKEIIKALIYLHENKIIHRDVRGSNILVTKEGEIKLSDMGISKELRSIHEKTGTCIGSPGWMAPELITNNSETDNTDNVQYGNRSDVWSIGITAIELGDGKSPYQNMHPSRALFQIVRNPPPTLYRPGNWTEPYNDFINECLVKNPEYRPYVAELFEHPFLTEVPENDYHLTQEIKALFTQFSSNEPASKTENALVVSKCSKNERSKPLERLYVEDLAILDEIDEDTVLSEIYYRAKENQLQTFIGDILLVLNTNEPQDLYGEEYHSKYKLKSRSDNAPHIFGVADIAYQAALHHGDTQHIILTGETCSGKTKNFWHLMDHLLYLGKNANINQERIRDGVKLLQAFTNASTPNNDHSTRCLMQTKLIFGDSGKNSGATFEVFQLEKNRISLDDINQANFHVLYYFYDGLEATQRLNAYHLSTGRNYQFLRTQGTNSTRARDNPKQNLKNFEKIQEIFKIYDFTDLQTETIFKVLAVILNLGQLHFEHDDTEVTVKNPEYLDNISQLLQIDKEQFEAVFTNCMTDKDVSSSRRNPTEQANFLRNNLANNLYSKLVDFIVAVLNRKLSYGAVIFGDKYSVKLLDFFGFESFSLNQCSQLIVNTFNEQLQFLYNQKIFGWEALDMTEEGITYTPYQYYDNKETLDQILGKPEGLFAMIDDSGKMGQDPKTITEYLQHQEQETMFVNNPNNYEFSINHYTGRVTYNIKDMPEQNRNFLSPELTDVLKKSNNQIIKMIYRNKLTKSGNSIISFDTDEDPTESMGEDQFLAFNSDRTEFSSFRSTGIEIMKELIKSSGVHFVRCIRSNLQENSNEFHTEVVKQQLQYMEIVETARARKIGFSCRIPFFEFLKRYKFLAFESDEEVEVTKDSCRLLLVRLKMEGWLMGKSKVFLKYFNEEYLQRLYEIQVKKVIKIQSIIRSYLVKRRSRKNQQSSDKSSAINSDNSEEDAALVIQKAYRKYQGKKTGCPSKSTTSDTLDQKTNKLLRRWCGRWKTKSIFQVLLQYRAAKYQELFNFSQQIHLYNQNIVATLHRLKEVNLYNVDEEADVNLWIGRKKPSVLKLPFHLDQLPYFDTSHMRDPLTNFSSVLEKYEKWDTPFQQISPKVPSTSFSTKKPKPIKPIQKPFVRNRNVPPGQPPTLATKPKSKFATNRPQNFRANYSQQNFNAKPKSYTSNRYEEEGNYNTTSANKDFEFIKPTIPEVKLRTFNPVSEMQNICRRESNSEDDPPFNFQAMLRKTNYNPEVNKINKEKMNARSANMIEQTYDGRNYDNVRCNRGNGNNSRRDQLPGSRRINFGENKEIVSIEIMPDLYLSGVVYDV